MSEPSPLAGVQHHARLRRDAGDLSGARATLADALDAAKVTYGEDHREVLSTAHLLARMHREAAEPAAARRVLEEALAAGQRRFGDSDPLLLAISFDLGWVAEELGNRHEARRNFGRVASAGPAVLGQDHWAVRAARDYLGEPAVTGPASTPAATAGPAASAVTPSAAEPASSGPTATMASTAGPPATARPAGPAGVTNHPPGPAPATLGVPQEGPAGPPLAVVRTGSPPARLPSHPAPAHPLEPPRPSAPPPRRGRGATIAAGVAAVAATVAAGLAAVAVLRGGDAGSSGPIADQTTGSVALSGEPPTDLQVARQGDTMILTWRDPTPGRVSFVVTGAPPGATLRLLGQLPAGTTRFPLNGVNATAGYCFRVAAVYSTETIGVSPVVCTDATAPTPTG
ncbi:MAG TPA: tetratricopeptide repeat protein [Pilimelia sp.]|nr:tetratricopeptide repeat protein [Pilimelia sp.]